MLSDLFDLEARGNPRRKAFDQLRRTPQHYDPIVLEAVQRNLVEAQAESSGHAIGIKDLYAGCEVLTAIETTDGMLVAPAGTILSETMLERIHNFAELMGIREPIQVRAPAK